VSEKGTGTYALTEGKCGYSRGNEGEGYKGGKRPVRKISAHKIRTGGYFSTQGWGKGEPFTTGRGKGKITHDEGNAERKTQRGEGRLTKRKRREINCVPSVDREIGP